MTTTTNTMSWKPSYAATTITIEDNDLLVQNEWIDTIVCTEKEIRSIIKNNAMDCGWFANIENQNVNYIDDIISKLKKTRWID